MLRATTESVKLSTVEPLTEAVKRPDASRVNRRSANVTGAKAGEPVVAPKKFALPLRL